MQGGAVGRVPRREEAEDLEEEEGEPGAETEPVRVPYDPRELEEFLAGRYPDLADATAELIQQAAAQASVTSLFANAADPLARIDIIAEYARRIRKRQAGDGEALVRLKKSAGPPKTAVSAKEPAPAAGPGPGAEDEVFRPHRFGE